MNLQQYATHISQGENGIWYAENPGDISYPEEGNETGLILEEDSFWFAHRNRCIVSVVKNSIVKGTLFDIGGGNGYVSNGLMQHGLNVILVEPGHVGACNAAKRGVKNIICAPLEDAGFKASSMDAVGMFDVLEHIEDQEGFLQNVHRCLKGDGNLFLTVPAYNFLWSSEDDSTGHFRRYTLSSLERVLKGTGFEVKYSGYMFFFLPIPIFFFRVVPGWLGYRKSIDTTTHKREHSRPSSLAGSFLDAILDREHKKIAEGQKIPFGGSCLVSAKKI